MFSFCLPWSPRPNCVHNVTHMALPPRYRCEVLRSACPSVCPSVSMSFPFQNHTSKVHGSVFLWQQCNMLFTSGFEGDVRRAHNSRAWATGLGPFMLKVTRQGQHQPRANSDVDDCLGVSSQFILSATTLMTSLTTSSLSRRRSWCPPS